MGEHCLLNQHWCCRVGQTGQVWQMPEPTVNPICNGLLHVFIIVGLEHAVEVALQSSLTGCHRAEPVNWLCQQLGQHGVDYRRLPE